MNYHWLREFADSWGLVFMGLVFVVLIGWTFRRGARVDHRHAANSIFDGQRNRDRHDG